ncbi:tail protein X [Devosia sp. SD17-2]|uniref:tail protein X n=1 Tax=Devosia sp. SD17-2 TaxID=2976459 RepID=UPI0023D7E1BD|nr:tail protein X [Devosia sp. SD17-2]WEJ33851.1 tail protein X [Devosia sp. SD17-2]
MAQAVLIKRERMTLDLLLFQAYGAEGQALLEVALGLNPGLAGLGPHIPQGTTVTLPDRPAPDALRVRTVVSLFG